MANHILDIIKIYRYYTYILWKGKGMTNSQIEVLVQRNKELKEALEKADCMFQQIEDNVKKIPYYQEDSDYFSRLDNIWKCISQAINQDKWRIK